jgi:DNA-binding NtrC family response regulator
LVSKSQVTDNGTGALLIRKGGHTDIVLAEVRTPGLSGIELLKAVSQNSPIVDSVSMAGTGTIPAAVAPGS